MKKHSNRSQVERVLRIGAGSACLLLLPFLGACGNPFAPEKIEPEGGAAERPPAQEATTPEIAMDNNERAFNDRDKELYESLLDEDFWFTEPDCLGDLVFVWGREIELEIMGGSRDGSRPGIFEQFRTIDYEIELIRRFTELGRDFPKRDENDIDGHPDEDWEVFRARVRMLLLFEENEGFRVDQIMTFKLREAEDGTWKIARWIDDPLSGACGGGAEEGGDETSKLVDGGPIPAGWSSVKRSVF
jgi:hypothetical protein